MSLEEDEDGRPDSPSDVKDAAAGSPDRAYGRPRSRTSWQQPRRLFLARRVRAAATRRRGEAAGAPTAAAAAARRTRRRPAARRRPMQDRRRCGDRLADHLDIEHRRSGTPPSPGVLAPVHVGRSFWCRSRRASPTSARAAGSFARRAAGARRPSPCIGARGSASIVAVLDCSIMCSV